ncbi:MAG TPA: hypothetical protein VKT31_12285 [Solirubrobacteraceae bacterium]|nr:hypothetical protein [Solirubrobacteraceae bacterium]
MASIDHSTHLPALAEPHAREEVGNQLQALLVELIDLSLLGKQLHWSAVGPLFRPLHLQLDELIDSWRELGGHGRRAGRGDRAALDGQGTVPDAHQR